MRINKGGAPQAALAVTPTSVEDCPEEKSQFDSITTPLAVLVTGQEMLKLLVRVVDADGRPVAKARISPWALRSSQGHGPWFKDDERVGVGPQDIFCDDDGTAVVLYPHYRDILEQIRTLAVSLFVDHPNFAYVGSLHIDVPLDTQGPYEVKLDACVPLEIRPQVEGKSADLDNLFALWSDGRCWKNGWAPEKTAEGTLRFPAMRPGKNSVLLVTLDGDRATLFSRITDFEIKAGEPAIIDIPMRAGLRVHGILSDNLPRPVRSGRIAMLTLPPNGADSRRARWFSWARVEPDGTFTVDAWPAGEKLQLIALCDGYVAASGKAPEEVEHPPDAVKDSFNRPQVFDLRKDERITVVMTPLARCAVTAVDEADKPVAGVKVVSWPNVGWWNVGSQIYCDWLARGERVLRDRDYYKEGEKAFPTPFRGETDFQGKLTLELPAGSEWLTIESDAYELPVFLGERDVRVKLMPGKTTEAILRLQPRGTEKLGEWDKLAGVVFGCSTRDGRQICAMPGVRKKMDEFTERFREAKGKRDSKLLSEAYTAVADAFADVGDQAEVEKWRQKAAEQAAKVQDTQQPSPK